jgi:hypothetical protein
MYQPAAAMYVSMAYQSINQSINHTLTVFGGVRLPKVACVVEVLLL